MVLLQYCRQANRLVLSWQQSYRKKENRERERGRAVHSLPSASSILIFFCFLFSGALWRETEGLGKGWLLVSGLGPALPFSPWGWAELAFPDGLSSPWRPQGEWSGGIRALVSQDGASTGTNIDNKWGLILFMVRKVTNYKMGTM